MNRQEILRLAIDTYGEAAQTDMCIEEMSELTKALLKYRRLDEVFRYGDTGRECLDNIFEEIADVQIMLDQMRMIYGNSDEVEVFKIGRLEQRLFNSGDDIE